MSIYESVGLCFDLGLEKEERRKNKIAGTRVSKTRDTTLQNSLQNMLTNEIISKMVLWQKKKKIHDLTSSSYILLLDIKGVIILYWCGLV